MKANGGKLIAVVQPHRYSRLRDLFDDFCICFNEADMVIVADVYAAGEAPIAGFGKMTLSKAYNLVAIAMLALASPEALADMIADHASAGDIVMCLGAGTITNWAAALPAELARKQGQEAS